MQTETYGVLKCKIVEIAPVKGKMPHSHIHTIADGTHFRISINIKSESEPHEVLYYIDDNFENKIIEKLKILPFGFNEIGPNIKKEYGIDYLRGDIFDLKHLRPLPDMLPGPDNDLSEKIHAIAHKALQNQESVIYAFGKRWPTENKKDDHFRFSPCEGIHDIHMNQGNSGIHKNNNNSWEDGALLVHFLPENRWNAVFLAFQSQSFNL